MPYIAHDVDQTIASTNGWLGVNTECVSLVRAMSSAPPSGLWRKGDLVQGNRNIQKGTIIATFEDGQHYHGHAAVYLGETPDGILVYDQWNAQKAHTRIIHYSGKHAFVDTGTNYYVVE
jgi:hypothetical protein